MTSVQVCNAALGRLADARITSLTDNNTAARSCNQWLPLARLEVLRATSWAFARKRAELTQLADAPLFGYSYQYALPSDFVRLVEMNGVSGTGPPSADWQIEGGNLLANQNTCQIVYIYDVTDYGAWDELAIGALTLYLGYKIGPAIQGGSTGKAEQLLSEYREFMRPLASRVGANESRRRRDNQMDAILNGSRVLRARRSGV